MRMKAVISAAGSGTRMLPATKAQPKEMLPVFVRGTNGEISVKPFLQVIFERLYDAGHRDFCFIVGRGKRSIEDHFTLDYKFVQQASRNNRSTTAKELSGFCEKVARSNIVFVTQPEPRGFGDAVARAKDFTGREPFLVHAGDDLIVSKDNSYVERLVRVFRSHDADAVFYVQKIKDARKYGVINGRRIRSNLYQVAKIEEKPLFPASNLAAIAVYVFSPRIYAAIEETKPDANNETQLTDAIQCLINDERPVYALELGKKERRIEIGTPESYWRARSLVSARSLARADDGPTQTNGT
jgi:UTP--glucose-1-phosphate uridylyltransferase